MLYIGMDVHSKWSCIRGFNPETGETINHPRVPNNLEALREVFDSLDGPFYGAMEIGTNAWAMYWTLLEFFEKLIVVDALETWGKEGRRGPKTDGRDALGLAFKMSRGELNALYVPDKVTQDYRCLIRARVNATRRVTKLVNEVGSLLRSWGVMVSSSLLTQKGEKLIEDCRERLPENALFVLDGLIEQLRLAKELEGKLTGRIEKLAAGDDTCKLLMSIPDIGPITAFAVRAEVGEIGRFASAKHLVSYCGLGPVVSQSADRIHYKGLPKACNKILKYLLILRGSGLARGKRDNPLRRAFIRTAMRGHVNDGKISAARKLVRIMYAMMKHKEPWDLAKAAARCT
jgi:transposase